MLASLKNEKMSSKEKKKETEAFLGPLAEERFALLLNLGKKITDFGHDPNAAKVRRRLILLCTVPYGTYRTYQGGGFSSFFDRILVQNN